MLFPKIYLNIFQILEEERERGDEEDEEREMGVKNEELEEVDLARLCVCACCCYCVRVVRLGGQVGLGLAIEGIERIQRAKPLASPSSYVAPTYENPVLVH